MGWQNVFAAFFQAGNTVEINSTGIFMWNGVPAINNLVFAVNPSIFSIPDGAGNQVPPGPGAFVFSNQGGAFYAQSISFLTGAAAHELWIGTGGQTAWVGSGIIQIQLPSGLVDILNLLRTEQGIQLSNAFSAPSANANGPIYYADNFGASSPQIVRPSGQRGYVSTTVTDVTDNSNNNAGTLPISIAWTIDANDAVPGTVYELEVPVSGTFQTTSLGFVPSLNGVSVATSGGDTIGGAFFAANAAFTGTVRLKVMIFSSTVAKMFIDGGIGVAANRSSGVNNNDATLNSQNTNVTINLAASNTIAINSVWGGAVAGQVVTGHGSEFTRKGP